MPEFLARRLSMLRQENAATRLLNYINAKELQSEPFDSPRFLKDLALATVLILNECADPKFIEIIENFGWNGSDAYEAGLDIRGLRMALKRQIRKMSSFGLPSFQHKESVTCFVPEILISLINDCNALKPPQNKTDRNSGRKISTCSLNPQSHFFHGVCLLVDISGFTKLSGRFCADGMNGIDDLQRLINDYLGELVGIIYTCCGDIIKFAGDAILCVFTDVFHTSKSAADGSISTNDLAMENNRLKSEICLQAIQCAMMLKDIYTDELTVHIGLSYGEMCFGILGGFHSKFECLVSGACLQDLSYCLDDAKSRQVVSKDDKYTVSDLKLIFLYLTRLIYF